MNLTGRVAIVTGGARGIGLAVVEDFVRQGANVVLVDSGVGIGGEPGDAGLAEEVAKRFEDKAAGLAGDIADADVARKAVTLAVDRFGGVDIVVNNAAIIRDGFIFKPNYDAFDAVIRNNLTGAYRLLGAATPVMRDQVKAGRAPGAIINIVSTVGMYGNYGQAAYGAAKAGLIGLTRVVALDLARTKITSNAIAPFASTRVTESIQPATPEQKAYKEKALRVPASYVGRMASFLATPAASNITGQIFGVRGREIMIFRQARPAGTVIQPEGGFSLDAFADNLKPLEQHYAELVSDLDAFAASDPVL